MPNLTQFQIWTDRIIRVAAALLLSFQFLKMLEPVLFVPTWFETALSNSGLSDPEGRVQVFRVFLILEAMLFGGVVAFRSDTLRWLFCMWSGGAVVFHILMAIRFGFDSDCGCLAPDIEKHLGRTGLLSIVAMTFVISVLSLRRNQTSGMSHHIA